MGKNGKNNNNNFFSQNIRERGEDFINFMNAKDIQYSSVKVFRELSRGKIDLVEYGQYFLDKRFLDGCLIEAHNKYRFYSISYNGVVQLINAISYSGQQVDTEVVAVAEDHKKSMEAYGFIIEGLNAVMTTGDPMNLLRTVSVLTKYRNNI